MQKSSFGSALVTVRVTPRLSKRPASTYLSSLGIASGKDNDLYKSDLIRTSKMEFTKYLQLTQDDCLMHAWSKKTMEEFVVNSSFAPPHPIKPVGALKRVGSPGNNLEATVEEVFPEFEVDGVKANAFLVTADTGRSNYIFEGHPSKWKEDHTANSTDIFTFVQFYYISEEYLIVREDIGVKDQPRTRAQLRKG